MMPLLLLEILERFGEQGWEDCVALYYLLLEGCPSGKGPAC